VLTTAAQMLASVRRTVKKNSLRVQKEPARANPLKDVKETLVGEARCSSFELGIDGNCMLRLRADVLFVQTAASAASSAGLEEESVELAGAEVESQGCQVVVKRNSRSVITIVLENERVAGLWATKMAVACGHTESIAKLFSIQRRQIQSLERTSMEAQINNEEVERCLNFLSREYVEMRYQVRRAPKKEEGKSTDGEPEREQTEEKEEKGKERATPVAVPELVEEAKEGDTDEEPLLIEDVEVREEVKHPSEPEKEPALSARHGAEKAKLVEAERVAQPEPRRAEVIAEDREVVPKAVPERAERAERVHKSHGHSHGALPWSLTGSPKGLSPKTATNSSRHRGTPTSEIPSRLPHARRHHGSEAPIVSPKDRSPYMTATGEGFDRRGHKLAMTHQRVLNRPGQSGQTRKSGRSPLGPGAASTGGTR